MKVRILSILLFAVQIGFAQIYIDSYRFAVEAPNLLLDDYPGSTAAYSLRKLDKDYTGSAIQIRTTGTGTNQPAGALTNIGFDLNGDLDETAIINHCLGTTCTVQTWYDQSGNGNDATQSTTDSQPTIYTGGAVVTEGAKPAIDFDGSNDYFNLTTEINVKLPNTSFLVSKRKTSSTFQIGFASTDDAGRPYSPFLVNNNILYFANSNSIYTSYSFNNNNRNLITGDDPFTTYLQIYVNGNLVANSGISDLSSTDGYTQIGARLSRNNYSNSIIQELVFYPQSKVEDGNRSNIETNINSYYSIY